MRMTVPIEVQVPTPTINITLPASIPLMCDGDEAARIFGISRRTLEQMQKTHPDFPVKRVGRSVNYLVPDLYAWFRDYPDRKIPVE